MGLPKGMQYLFEASSAKIYKNKRTEPYNKVTFDAANSTKAAANVKNENLYVEIKDLDLTAKGFKVHKHCYGQFTHGYTKGVRNEEQPSTSTDPKYNSGNFEAVKVFVCNHVLKLGKAASMKQLHDIYELGAGDSHHPNKLKAKVQNHFMDQILFLSPTTGTQSTELWFRLATTRNVLHTTKIKQYEWLQNYFGKILLKN